MFIKYNNVHIIYVKYIFIYKIYTYLKIIMFNIFIITSRAKLT